MQKYLKLQEKVNTYKTEWVIETNFTNAVYSLNIKNGKKPGVALLRVYLVQNLEHSDWFKGEIFKVV